MRILCFLCGSMVASILLSGCNTPDVESTATIRQNSSGHPVWVLNPDKPGFQSVIGSAPVQSWGGRTAQFRVAEMMARKEMAQMLRVHVKSNLTRHEELRGGKFTITGDVETRVETAVELSLNSARVIEEWTDPQNGTLYIWMVTAN